MKAVRFLLLASCISVCFGSLTFGTICPNVYCNSSTSDSGDVPRCYENKVEFAGPGAACNASRPCFPYFACRSGACVLKQEDEFLGCACNADQTCGGAFSDLICQGGVCIKPPPKANGQSCRGDSDCTSNFCDFSSGGVCSAKLGVNATCSYRDQCASDLCLYDVNGQTCQLKVANGQPCIQADQCATGACIFNTTSYIAVCSVPLPLNAACTNVGDCAAPNVCNNQKCGPQVANGQNATTCDERACVSGYLLRYPSFCTCSARFPLPVNSPCDSDEDCSSAVCGCAVGNATSCYERRCVNPLSGAVGSACGDTGRLAIECASGLFCDYNRRCQALGSVANGQRCSESPQCASRICNQNTRVCQAEGSCSSSAECGPNSLCQCTNTNTKTYGCVMNASVPNVFNTDTEISLSCFAQYMIPFQKTNYADYVECRTNGYLARPSCAAPYAKQVCCSACALPEDFRFFSSLYQVDCAAFTLRALPQSCGATSVSPVTNCGANGNTNVTTTESSASSTSLSVLLVVLSVFFVLFM